MLSSYLLRVSLWLSHEQQQDMACECVIQWSDCATHVAPFQELAAKQIEEQAAEAKREREARRQRLLSEEETRMKKEHEAFEAELRR